MYKIFKKFARLFERDMTKKLEYIPVKRYHAILFGCDRMGQSILKTLKQMKKNVLVVDFDPEVVKEHMITRQPCIYGDIGDLEVLKSLRFDKASLVVSTIPDYEDNKLILQKAKEANSEIVVFVTAGHAEEALELYMAGADYVILPRFLSGERVAMLIEDVRGNLKKVLKYKIRHMDELKKKKNHRRHI